MLLIIRNVGSELKHTVSCLYHGDVTGHCLVLNWARLKGDCCSTNSSLSTCNENK